MTSSSENVREQRQRSVVVTRSGRPDFSAPQHYLLRHTHSHTLIPLHRFGMQISLVVMATGRRHTLRNNDFGIRCKASVGRTIIHCFQRGWVTMAMESKAYLTLLVSKAQAGEECCPSLEEETRVWWQCQGIRLCIGATTSLCTSSTYCTMCMFMMWDFVSAWWSDNTIGGVWQGNHYFAVTRINQKLCWQANCQRQWKWFSATAWLP